MAEYTGKVAWECEHLRYYAIPDDVEDKNVNPQDCETVIWISDNDDPDDLGGHFELSPSDISELDFEPEVDV